MYNLQRLLAASAFVASSALAAPVHFATNDPDGRMAMATHPASGALIEHEAGDDFVLADTTRITHASFTGLLAAGATPATVSHVVVEIYRVFPLDSVDPPSGQVPTRANSPSDIAFASRASGDGLHYATAVIDGDYPVQNSVLNGIHPAPYQTTHGDGPVTGQEVRFDVTFDTPLLLPVGHYFFVPQVEVSSGVFYWLSAPKPIVAPGTPFTGDLQAWVRDENLAPDWLRVGTDIVGGAPPPTFNASFSLDGETSGAVHFATNDPDGLIAVATRPPTATVIENEAGDDFVLADPSRITHATFTGLIPSDATFSGINRVAVEIYRVFPFDSDTTRIPDVPTRAKSPGDNAFDTRDSTVADGLSYAPVLVNATFGAANSVLDGIHPSPNQTTLGEGAVNGKEVLFDVTFSPPFSLPAGHYFFVPQVGLANGFFYWLSAPKPIIAPGTPFTPDLQAWIRNENLAPDWLRIGTDIVGGATPPTFNATFSIDGDTDAIFHDGLDGPG